MVNIYRPSVSFSRQDSEYFYNAELTYLLLSLLPKMITRVTETAS